MESVIVFGIQRLDLLNADIVIGIQRLDLLNSDVGIVFGIWQLELPNVGIHTCMYDIGCRRRSVRWTGSPGW